MQNNRSCKYCEMSDNSQQILIVGGGLGGLSTALALGKKGIAVRLLEQSEQIGAIGYGIQMGPNVFRAFRQLGIADAVRAKSHFPSALLMLDAYSGEQLAAVPLMLLSSNGLTIPMSLSIVSICTIFSWTRAERFPMCNLSSPRLYQGFRI